ncbi:amidase [Aureimonas endophytica]|uniref:Amidase n=1 Tax=Aureimonas endophytica TaxID=2027858 RepID=A0A917A1L4_9HYPH|nr:amidase [Aureimonas endophytica]GGE21281.1 amidase [Aureimonas endophytica]
MAMTPKTDLGEMSAVELSALFAAGKASPVEATRAALDRIERFDPLVNAFAHVVPEAALAAARESEARWARGEPRGPLDGAPTTIKELTAVIGIPWRRGSNLTDTAPSTREILIVKRLRAAGAVILGTTTSPEFGWKGVTHGPAFGNTLNPWRTDRASGGSSGGAAVAAALNMGVLHEGSDGAGSIRIPGAWSGVFGIKPTFGWVPADAPTPLMELAHRGPLTRTVEDSALFLNAVTGPSPEALYGDCPAGVPDWTAAAKGEVRGLRIGYSRDFGYARVAPDVAAAVERAARRLAEMGAVVEEVDPGFASPLEALRVLWFAAESVTVDQFARTKADRARMDPGLVAIAEIGRRFTAQELLAAERVRSELKVTMARFHERHDVLLSPTMPITALPAGIDFPEGEGMTDWTDWSPFTYPFNMTGQPAVSVPCGFDAGGLPIGVQFVAARFHDDLVLRLAAAYQAAHPEAFPAAPVIA